MASGSVKMGTIFMLLLILKLYNLETFMKSNFVVEISTENYYIYISSIYVGAILRISAFPFFYIYKYISIAFIYFFLSQDHTGKEIPQYTDTVYTVFLKGWAST